MRRQIVPVSYLANRIKLVLESDDELNDVWVDGEVSGARPAKGGHYYMTLRDEETQIPITMWRSTAQRQSYVPQEGDQVTVHGSLDFYIPYGKYSLVIDVIQPAGQGLRQLQLEQLRIKLEAEGLFDPSRKRPIPSMPRKIGVVTSPTGAVWHDIQRVVGRRFPLTELVLAPATVQGDQAAPTLVRAIQALNDESDIDVIIVARGGGSFEDLYCFNDEAVLRQIYASRVPVISAIGHETDDTLADLVADLRAPTPSVAGELATPDLGSIGIWLEDTQAELKAQVEYRLEQWQWQLEALEQRLRRISPVVILGQSRTEIANLAARMQLAAVRSLEQAEQQLIRSSAMLETLNPRAVLARGYGFVTDQSSGRPIRSVDHVSTDDKISVTLKNGTISASVLGHLDVSSKNQVPVQ